MKHSIEINVCHHLSNNGMYVFIQFCWCFSVHIYLHLEVIVYIKHYISSKSNVHVYCLRNIHIPGYMPLSWPLILSNVHPFHWHEHFQSITQHNGPEEVTVIALLHRDAQGYPLLCCDWGEAVVVCICVCPEAVFSDCWCCRYK